MKNGTALKNHSMDGRRCAQCGKIYGKGNLIRLWRKWGPGPKDMTRELVKLCTHCLDNKQVERVAQLAHIQFTVPPKAASK